MGKIFSLGDFDYWGIVDYVFLIDVVLRLRHLQIRNTTDICHIIKENFITNKKTPKKPPPMKDNSK